MIDWDGVASQADDAPGTAFQAFVGKVQDNPAPVETFAAIVTFNDDLASYDMAFKGNRFQAIGMLRMMLGLLEKDAVQEAEQLAEDA